MMKFNNRLKGKWKYWYIFSCIQWFVPFPIKRFINWILVIKLNKKTDINHTNFFQLWDILGKRVTIWENTYIGPNWTFFAWDDIIDIWKYCSIAGNCFMITYNHSTKYITSHVNQYKKKINLNQEIKHWSIIIWNDVRIGQNCIILSWVKIWNWAIIWAWSVVTKDIPPYWIVWWNPAKLIKYRFSQKEIDYIENLKRWDRPIEKIKKNEKIFNTEVKQLCL